MAKIKVHAGDFSTTGASFMVNTFEFLEPDKVWSKIKYHVSDLEELEEASEESVKRVGGTVGWGAVGGALLGPVGLLAGLLAGGRGKDVTFVARFKDGRKVLGTVNHKAFVKMKAGLF